jgi:hypothetical protein
MDASKITQLLQKQNTRYINRSQTVDASTLIWKNQIQSSKYIKGVKTCDGQQNCNVPTNPACSDANNICAFGGAGRTTAIQTGSSKQFLSVYSGAAGSASHVYSSEAIMLQQAGKASCGVAGVNPAPSNSYVVLPGGNPNTSNSELQVPSAKYFCSNTNGPINGESVPINNNLNEYLPPFDTYYAMKHPECNYPIQDQNQRHPVIKCNQCPEDTVIPGLSNTHEYVVNSELGISYSLPECPIDVLVTTYYPVTLASGTPQGGIFTIIPPGPGLNPVTIDSVTGTLIIPPQPGGTDPTGIYIIKYSINNFIVETSVNLQGC